MKVLKVLAILVAALFVGAGSCVGYVGYRSHRAKTLVAEFCKRVKVGQPSARLKERAEASGLDVSELPDRPPSSEADGPLGVPSAAPVLPTGSTLMCSQGVLLARHICEIKIDGGQVVKVDQGFVD